MARPRKGDEKGWSERVGFRVPPWVKDALAAEAEKTDRSMGEVINEILARSLKGRGYKPLDDADA